MTYPWYIQLSLVLIPSLIVAVVTAILTVKLSVRKFYTERWWERKADAYSRIIEALHRHKNYVEQKLEIEMSYPKKDRTKEEKEDLEKQWTDANAELERAADLGAFVISEETEEIIKKFLKRPIDAYDVLLEAMEVDLSYIKNCLLEVKAAAKKDLKF